MSILEELKMLIESLNIPIETGYFDNVAPELYAVLTPMNDNFDMFADDSPNQDVKYVRISIFTKSNYLELKKQLEDSILRADFIINQRYYVEYEPDTKYHHIAIDISKHYEFMED